MASSKDYLFYIQEQLRALDAIRFRPMMGEYLLYYKDKLIGGVYDDRLLIKVCPSVIKLMKEPVYEQPYEGAKDMLMPDTEDRGLPEAIVEAAYAELPVPKAKKKREIQ